MLIVLSPVSGIDMYEGIEILIRGITISHTFVLSRYEGSRTKNRVQVDRNEDIDYSMTATFIPP